MPYSRSIECYLEAEEALEEYSTAWENTSELLSKLENLAMQGKAEESRMDCVPVYDGQKILREGVGVPEINEQRAFSVPLSIQKPVQVVRIVGGLGHRVIDDRTLLPEPGFHIRILPVEFRPVHPDAVFGRAGSAAGLLFRDAGFLL